MSIAERFLLLFAGLAGAAGVAFSAMAAHGDFAPMLKTCADILLMHAPALLGVVALTRNSSMPRRILLLGGFLLLIGVALFCGDLARRTFFEGQRLFPMAAPTGGSIMIAGWLLLAITALLPRRH